MRRSASCPASPAAVHGVCLTLAGAVIVSGFVALTLSPMMCSKLLKHQGEHNLLYRIIERVLAAGSRPPIAPC